MDTSYTMLRADGTAAGGEQERQLLRAIDQLSEASASDRGGTAFFPR
jgi:hypothetical protein